MSEAGSARFRYRAARSDGSVARGTVLAGDAREAGRRLEADGLLPLSIEAVRASRRSARPSDLAALFRNIAILTGSGVPVERAIHASERVVPEALRVPLGEVRRLIREGRSVADALAEFPDLFPRTVIGMVRAGEAGGLLADACDGIADQLDETAELRSQVRSALAYPALILVVGMTTIAVICGVVVPRFALLLTDLGAELPRATVALLTVTDGIRTFGPMIVFVVVLSLPMLAHAFRSEAVRTRLDRVLLGIPALGELRKGFASARVCRSLGGMLSTGMPLMKALHAAADAAGDHEVRHRLEAARESVRRGTPLTAALEEAQALTEQAVQLIGVGEAGGRLAEMAHRAGDVTARTAQRRLRALVGLVEPTLIVALGGLVAGVAAILLQAVYSVRAF